MAETSQAPVNGNFFAHPAYPGAEPFNPSHAVVNNGNGNSAAGYQPAQTTVPSNPAPSAESKETKDGIHQGEVGWFFVEQYYTTMSRCPEKLHLFYNRRSHFVNGNEAESVPVLVGQKAIQEKIKELDFQDCKVRVLNVDSQASFDNILVSVIGEISNKSEPSRKFVQTFVLAQQPGGYYVLNDIFRNLADEDEELIHGEVAAPAEAPTEAPAATSGAIPAADADAVAEPKPEPEPEAEQKHATEAQVTNPTAAAVVDEKLEEAAANGDVDETAAPTTQVNGAAASKEPIVPVTPAVPAIPVEPESLTEEKPPEPEPTPVVSSPKPAPAAVEKKDNVAPAKAAPKTWANIVSKPTGNAPAVTPAVPASQAKSAAPSAAAQPQQPAQTQQPVNTAVVPEPTSETPTSQPSSSDGSGWQTAGHDHNKRQSRATEEQNTLAYIKNVNEKVDAALLKQTLSRFGKIKYFDVNRAKSCAFVEFGEPAGYAAAVAANPHQIGSEQVTVEERRRGNAYGGNNGYSGGRGGSNRPRGDGRSASQGRGGFQREGGRGGFTARGRGGAGGAKGRGQAQAA